MQRKAFIVACLMGIAGCSADRPSDPDWLIQHGSSAQKEVFFMELGYSENASNADVLYRFLDDEDPEIVAKAAWWIGYLNARDYVPTLVDLLEHEDRQVVNMAGGGLAKMADSRDVRYLDRIYPVLDHEYLLARMSAIEVIGVIGSSESTKFLLERLSDEEPAAKWQIARALGRIGDVRALPALKQFQQAVQLMDHSVPNKGGVRGSDPHPESLEAVAEEAIAMIESGM
ncbi:MAG: HEAT repeat domain-containing protein [Gammaproteobacteria bacterium]|jgi:HEAT repeat protein|nr:HEAT repeat domain-containing protein [Gammaproteobacteria bacterium]